MKWKYLGRVLRTSAERLPRIIFLYNPPAYWKRPSGGVRLTNERYFKKACEKLIMRPFNLSRKKLSLLGRVISRIWLPIEPNGERSVMIWSMPSDGWRQEEEELMWRFANKILNH